MSTNDQTITAARILVDRRRSGAQGARLPETCRPWDLESALAVQAEVTRQLGATIGGWKCLQPPPDRWVIGPIYRNTIHQQSPCPVWAQDGRAKIEPELAFVFAQGLPPRDEPYTPDDVDAAIGSTHLALELIYSRYSDPASVEFPEMLADGLVNQGLYIGPEVNAEQARQASEMPISVFSESEAPQELDGRHPNAHPRTPLYWLAEFLRSRGQGIEAGQAVITGSYAGVLEVPLNEELAIRYGDLGTLKVSFNAQSA
jgi:2-keto-4-pentenoate hydratase